jgi:hypothetical protein
LPRAATRKLLWCARKYGAGNSIGEEMTTSEPGPVYPVGGAGLFDVDPDQSIVNQDPNVVVTSDMAALPVDMEP